MGKFETMSKQELRQACREAGISYGKLTVGGMRDTLRAKTSDTMTTRKAKAADVVVSIAPVNQAAPAVQPVQEQHVAQPAAAPTRAPCAATPAPAPSAAREERNGIRRPKPGGKCAAVWNYLDEHGNMEAKDIREAAPSQGWNLANAQIELSQWRKFMGLGKPAT